MMWQWIGWSLFVIGVAPAIVVGQAWWQDWRHSTRRRTRRWKGGEG